MDGRVLKWPRYNNILYNESKHNILALVGKANKKKTPAPEDNFADL